MTWFTGLNKMFASAAARLKLSLTGEEPGVLAIIVET